MATLRSFHITVHVDDTGVTEAGWGMLHDAISDAALDGVLHDVVVDAVGSQLPLGFPGVWGVRVEECA